jgi:hypothetical protein
LSPIRLEILTIEVIGSQSAATWRKGLTDAQSLMERVQDAKRSAAATLLCMIFVRDEYVVFDTETKLALIRKLLTSTNSVLGKAGDDKPFVSFLFGLKAGLT